VRFDASRLKARWRTEAAARCTRSARLLADAREKAAPPRADAVTVDSRALAYSDTSLHRAHDPDLA
jgi:hypothetical protein